jgi:NADH-quinone oxidoreductase subunit C
MISNLEQLQAEFERLTAGTQPLRPPAPPPPPVPAAPAAAPASAAASGVAAPVAAQAPPAPAQPATPAPPPAQPPLVQVVDPKKKGYHLDVLVTPEHVVTAAKIADQYGFGMDTVTGVDWMAAGQMEVVYDYFHPACALHLVVRTRVPRDHAEVPTIQSVFPGANWHERETHEFLGIQFLGHPNLTPLLLPEDADYHPLRKDFAGAAA